MNFLKLIEVVLVSEVVYPANLFITFAQSCTSKDQIEHFVNVFRFLLQLHIQKLQNTKSLSKAALVSNN